jgi:hypothetical protein
MAAAAAAASRVKGRPAPLEPTGTGAHDPAARVPSTPAALGTASPLPDEEVATGALRRMSLCVDEVGGWPQLPWGDAVPDFPLPDLGAAEVAPLDAALWDTEPLPRVLPTGAVEEDHGPTTMGIWSTLVFTELAHLDAPAAAGQRPAAARSLSWCGQAGPRRRPRATRTASRDSVVGQDHTHAQDDRSDDDEAAAYVFMLGDAQSEASSATSSSRSTATLVAERSARRWQPYTRTALSPTVGATARPSSRPPVRAAALAAARRRAHALAGSSSGSSDDEEEEEEEEEGDEDDDEDAGEDEDELASDGRKQHNRRRRRRRPTEHEKKQSHSAMERRRRSDLGRAFQRLRAALPALAGERAPKISVLQEVNVYLDTLHDRTATRAANLTRLRQERERLRQLIPHLSL